jgi:hypothetical protein
VDVGSTEDDLRRRFGNCIQTLAFGVDVAEVGQRLQEFARQFLVEAEEQGVDVVLV